MTITEFLKARISEDEALVNATLEDMKRRGWGDWREESIQDGHGMPAGYLIAEFSPARVLAECAAKRAIIRSYRSCIAAEDTTKDFGPRLVTSGMVKGLEVAIKLLASTYASHEDYREEWAL